MKGDYKMINKLYYLKKNYILWEGCVYENEKERWINYNMK